MGWRRRGGEEVSDDGFVAAANGSLPARFRFQFPLLIAAGQLPDPQKGHEASKGESNSFRDPSPPCLSLTIRRFHLSKIVSKYL